METITCDFYMFLLPWWNDQFCCPPFYDENSDAENTSLGQFQLPVDVPVKNSYIQMNMKNGKRLLRDSN